ncbi:phage baseplate assembly protein [Humitalea sp. 24SJ18S-53]|uniref:phage baseplate assembly protein n=1 Tax=Humitalea sp. 24SJ18S-53 TaxID=3422307 RepID=UPI003D668CB4
MQTTRPRGWSNCCPGTGRAIRPKTPLPLNPHRAAALGGCLQISRDLGEIAGGFTLRVYDAGRVQRAGGLAGVVSRIKRADAIEILADDERLLVGFVDATEVSWTETSLDFSVTGRDKTGDLVDCAAAPDGPAEYRNVTLTDLARRLCQPFGITARAEVDVGPVFPRFALDPDETIMDALEKACKQRAVLALSDGVGGLVLTRSGQNRAPAGLSLPGNVAAGHASSSTEERFARYIVKGQSGSARGTGGPALASGAAPLEEALPPPAATERARIIRTGLAVDPEITRHRPKVFLSRTESGGASLQTQAEWRMRVARGRSDVLAYTVPGWRAGADRRLWRPNELCHVQDAPGGITGDMLIRGLRFTVGDKGAATELKLVGPEAFDLEDEGTRRRRRDPRGSPAGDSTARELTPDLPAARPRG